MMGESTPAQRGAAFHAGVLFAGFLLFF